MIVSVNPVLMRVLAVSTFALALLLGAPECVRAGVRVEPIRFARGASSAEVHAAVVRGERALYSIAARAGQDLSLRLTSVEDNAAVQIYAPGAKLEMRDSILEVVGRALPGAGEGEDATRWMGRLPESGSYLLVVGPTRGNATYTLSVAIR
jgi:hypothetical protein